MVGLQGVPSTAPAAGGDPESRTLSPPGLAEQEPEQGPQLSFRRLHRCLLGSKSALSAEKAREKPFGFFCDLVYFRISARPLSVTVLGSLWHLISLQG